ncbi:MAG: histidine--tRNA ligase, partial [Candidatus Pacebacteria bacterium]|nr:histidine--tRNA ligase [Candidatus Paceibacterota bacterium]
MNESDKNKKEVPISLKGMHDLMDETYYAYQGLFEKAQEVAVYYGFKPIETPTLEREEVFTSALGEGTDVIDKEMYTFKGKGGDRIAVRPEYTASVMRSYLEHGMQTLPQPVMLYSYGPVYRHENPQRGRLRQFRQFNLEILGTEKSIADALIIRTLITILEEFGFKDLIVDINSMGDKETRPTFLKDLTNYYKKHLESLCKDCHERIKTNPLRLLDCKQLQCQPFKDAAPSSLSYLSNDARSHFKEVLQYLEEMGIAYRINNSLVRGLDYYSRTVFEVIKIDVDENGKEKDITVTGGGRYNGLAKMMGSKKEVPAVGTGLGIERIMMFPECKNIPPRIMKTPRVYFIQLGFEAKLKSLCIVETLRKARVPVYQSISKDSLGTQLAQAEKMEVPYVIIFGQKEAMDNTVIVRDMKTRSQDTVKIDALSDYI